MRLDTCVPSYIGTHTLVTCRMQILGCGLCNLIFRMEHGWHWHALFILILYFALHIFYLFTGMSLYLLTLISHRHLTLSTLTMSTNILITMPSKLHLELGFYSYIQLFIFFYYT